MEFLEEMGYAGDIPEGWKWVKLSEAPLEIIDGDRGKNYPSNNELKNNGYCLFLSTKNVKPDGFCFDECQFITKEKDEALKKGKLKRFDLVFTTRGTIGNVGYYNSKVKYENIRINSGMVIIRPDTRNLNPDFNYYVFKFIGKYINSFISGSVQPQLPIRDLKEVKIPLPPLHEQKAIAEVLSSIDDKIEILHRQNETLEEMAMILFRQWFIEPTKDGLPDGWEEVSLGDIFDIGIGRTPPRKESHWFSLNPKDIRWISVKDLGSIDTYIINTSEFLKEEAIKKFNIPIIPDNTVVLSFKLTVGRVGITIGEMVSNEAIAHFKPKPNSKISSNYLYLFLKTLDFSTFGSTSSIAEAINSKIIKEIKIQIPDDESILSFQSLIDPIFQKIRHNVFQIQTLERQRDTLLPKLMSGEIRVRI